IRITTELSDAGGPTRRNWQQAWPARIRSSDFVRPMFRGISELSVVGSYARPPSPDTSAICFIDVPKSALERGLLMPDYKEMSGNQKKAGVTKQWQGLINERGADQGESGPDIHWIPDIPVWSFNNQSARRVERHRCA